jgi:hypothetical protein
MTNRLALAKTIVTGSMTLQDNTFTFTASASGTAKADKVPEAKKLAVAASNNAAITAARASIDKILADNSAVLSDLEITSLISNNLSTTVVVFKPIGLATIASSSNGVNYTLNPNVTIGSNQWLTVPSGKTLSSTADNPLINNGYVQYGDGTQTSSGALKDGTCPASCSTGPLINSGTIEYSSGQCYIVDSGESNSNSGTITVDSGACFTIDVDYAIDNSLNFGNFGITTNNGTFTNSGNSYSNIYNDLAASFTNSSSGTLINKGNGSSFRNVCGGTFTNNGTITNSGKNSSSCESTGTGSCTGNCTVKCEPPPPPPQ